MVPRKHTDLWLDYCLYLRRRGLSKTTIDAYATTLKRFLADNDPLTATAASIEGWLDGRALGAKARGTYISTLAGFYAYLVSAGHLTESPAAKVVRPRQRRRLPRPCTDAQLQEAMSTADVRMRAWLSLAAYAGLRAKEIALLQVQDLRFDLDPPVIHLSATKGDKDRIIPIADEILDALKAYDVPAFGYVFPALDRQGHRTRRSMHPHHVSRTINEYLHAKGINAVGHQLRHWFGTKVYELTLNPLLVRDLMGHADLKTTSGYMALTPTAEAVRALRSLSVQEQAK